MGNETIIARVKVDSYEALAVCEAMTAALKKSGLPEDAIITLKMATGEHIKSLEIIADEHDGVADYTMVARLG